MHYVSTAVIRALGVKYAALIIASILINYKPFVLLVVDTLIYMAKAYRKLPENITVP